MEWADYCRTSQLLEVPWWIGREAGPPVVSYLSARANKVPPSVREDKKPETLLSDIASVVARLPATPNQSEGWSLELSWLSTNEDAPGGTIWSPTLITHTLSSLDGAS